MVDSVLPSGRLQTGNALPVSFKNTDPAVLEQLKRNQGVLRSQRVEFLRQQVTQLNEQLDFLDGLSAVASADQAEAVRSSLTSVGAQLDRLGQQITPLVDQDTPVEDLLKDFQATSQRFEASVENVVKALNVEQNSFDYLISFLDDFIERNKFDVLA